MGSAQRRRHCRTGLGPATARAGERAGGSEDGPWARAQGGPGAAAAVWLMGGVHGMARGCAAGR